jgi:hypothetical protein
MRRAFTLVSLAAVVTCSALCACGNTKPNLEPKNVTAEAPKVKLDLRSFALLESTGVLRTAPKDASTPLQLFASDAEAEKTNDDPNPVFRVLGEQKDFVELETVFDPDHDCHDGLLGVSKLRLKFYAHRSDLALVTPRARDIDYADGTRLTLAAGVTVRAVGTVIEANPSGQWIKTSLTRDDVEESYDPSAAFPKAEDPYGSFALAPKHGVHFADRVFPTFPSEKIAPADFVVIQAAEKTSSGGVLATVVERCAKYRVLLDAADVDEGEFGGLGLSGMGASGAMARIKRGSALHWADGRVAGSVREEDIDAPNDMVTNGERGCWNASLREHAGPIVRLCVDTKDLY